MQVRATVIPNYIGERIPVSSGLKIPAWRALLTDYHDKQLPDFLEFGWPADYSAETPPVSVMANHYNDAESVLHMEDYINTKLAHGSLLGPFDAPPFQPWTQVSPWMTRPKRGSNKRCVIVDLSYPKESSVNAGIRRAQYQGRPFTYIHPSRHN